MYQTFDEMWTDTIRDLLDKKPIDSRVGPIKETMGYSKTLENIRSPFLLNPRRRLSPMYACAEVLWYLKSTKSIEMIKAYAPQYEKFAEDGEAYGAYGYRLAHNTLEHQFDLLIKLLKDKPNTRQAILSIWTANDLYHSAILPRKDIPCTISLQFLIRDDRLHQIATMRSNDAWLGLPYDVFAFTTIQRLIGQAIRVKPGSYTHQAGSEHLYEKNWRAAEEALNQPRISSLIHGWTACEIPDWKSNIRLALCAEGRYRHGLDGRAELNYVTWPLYDCVACCAHQFGFDVIPYSPILQEALKNVNR